MGLPLINNILKIIHSNFDIIHNTLIFLKLLVPTRPRYFFWTKGYSLHADNLLLKRQIQASMSNAFNEY